MSITISDEQKQLFQDEGYLILPGVIPSEQLEMLREECARFIGLMQMLRRLDTMLLSHEIGIRLHGTTLSQLAEVARPAAKVLKA